MSFSADVMPEHWSWATLGDTLSGIEAGASFRCEERPPADNETGVAKVSAVTWGFYDEEESKTVQSSGRIDERLLIRPGDFLFSRANTIKLVGACVIARGVRRRVMLSDKILRLRVARSSPEFMMYYLRSENGRAEIERLATGNQESMRNIGRDRIRAIRVPVPPLAEQHRIVAAIEEHLTNLDAAVAALERARANVRRYRAAVLHTAMVEAEVASSAQGVGARGSKAGGTLLETIALEVRNGISAKPDAKSGLAILRISAVRPLRLDAEDVRYLRESSEQYERYELRSGDLLFTRYNGNASLVGACAVVPHLSRRTVYPDKLIRVRVDLDRALPAFVAIAAASGHTRDQISSKVKTTAGQAGISGGDLKRVSLPLPPVDVQARIVAEVERRLSVVDRTEAQITIELKRAARLRQSILKRAFEGKLVPQDPNDEPASVLLERMRGNSTAVETRASTTPARSPSAARGMERSARRRPGKR